MEPPAEQYKRLQKKVADLIEALGPKLEEHAKQFADDPGNYGYAGDLGRIAETLENIITPAS